MMLSTLVRDALTSVLRYKSSQHILRHVMGASPTRGQQIQLSDLPNSTSVLHSILEDIVIASNEDWKDDVLHALDLVYECNEIGRRSSYVNWERLQGFHDINGTKLHVHKGDITLLTVQAIVNAANDEGLGCFVPEHRCIDNVIHRRAGPRLRRACREAMRLRGTSLQAGTRPIVTDAYNLPSSYVIHVTGPQIHQSSRFNVPTESEQNLLADAYKNSLDACVQHNIRSIAFCGISTGLFGFPKQEAARIALTTVSKWLKENPGHLDAVVFDVFSSDDLEVYTNLLSDGLDVFIPQQKPSLRDQKLRSTLHAIKEADAVLICAGAGMSVKEGEMVYTNPRDFAKHYPWFPKWGYRTSYEVMGLGSDPSVPENAKWALHAKHMDNMRWTFTPNEGYATLLDLVQEKDFFVLTSNVDGCFERSGFDKNRIYTPQGEWTTYQCMRPCRPDAVFESRQLLDKLLPVIDQETGMIPTEAIPKCPYCGDRVFGNVRGGQWFLHSNYEDQNDALRHWMKEAKDSKKKVVVIEIGAGFNTPTVTRFPMESYVRETDGTLIRINPSDEKVPEDLRAISLKEGWQVLKDISEARPADYFDSIHNEQLQSGDTTSAVESHHMKLYFGHFDWNRFLHQLKD